MYQNTRCKDKQKTTIMMIRVTDIRMYKEFKSF